MTWTFEEPVVSTTLSILLLEAGLKKKSHKKLEG